MTKYRSLISLLLAFVATLLVSCSSPAEIKPPTYSSEQISQIQGYAAEISALRDRLPELQKLIQKEDWIYVRNFIHGPLGELRFKLTALSRNLLPDAQPEANSLSKEVFDHLVDIDRAAQDSNYKLAVRNYAEALKDLDAFLKLLPQG